MSTVREQIWAQDFQERISALRKAMVTDRVMAETLRRYVTMVGDVALGEEIFGTGYEIGVAYEPVSLIIPEERRIYIGESREQSGLDIEHLSRRELSFLLQAFLPREGDREYIIDLMFYEYAFIRRNMVDVMEYIDASAAIFDRMTTTRRHIHLVVDRRDIDTPPAANDEHYTPLIERIESRESGYFDYIHESYRMKLHYVESLFSHVIQALADDRENHLYALDPIHHSIYISPYLAPKVALIESICKAHHMIDADFPLLHTMLGGALRSWIYLYRWFAAPADSIRGKI